MIVVFGSINMDLVTRAPTLPQPGETLTGHGFTTVPGGKGANQAVACARLGVPTAMVGRVGADGFGSVLRENLEHEGVDVAGIRNTTDHPSGVAAIAIDDRGENTIIVVPGANGMVGADDVQRLDHALPNAKVLLLQLEVPLDAVVGAAQLARKHGVTTILDPAPAQPLPDALYNHIDIITPNQSEAAALVGFALDSDQAVERAATELLKRGVGTAVIKLGAKGAYYRQGDEHGFVPAFKVNAIDTVAAGDAFNGALAAAWSFGMPLAEAVRWGAAGGAFAATRSGAQTAMGRWNELELLLLTH